MTIMIVDDNPAVRRLIRRATSEIADEFFECEDGADALSAYNEKRPDLVLMDVRMPRMDGLRATRALVDEHPDAKVIIVTDYGDEELQKTAREAGACGFFLKENLLELDELLLAIYARPAA